MTKQEALTWCMNHWQWLADHPGPRRRKWEFWTDLTGPRYVYRNIGQPLATVNDCYCCDFTAQELGRAPLCSVTTPLSPEDQKVSKADREHCPLKSLWPNGCCEPDSVYNMWQVVTSVPTAYNEEKQREAALKIVAACKEELAKLNNEQQGN